MKTTINTLSPVWHDRADIPNAIGFRFVGLMSDGTEEICSVIRHEDGGHTLANNAWPRLAKWRRIPAGEITPRVYCQAAFDGYRSFALIRQTEKETAETVAVVEYDGKAVYRDLCAPSVGNAWRRAFLGAVAAAKRDNACPAPGTYGPAFDVPAGAEIAGELIAQPLASR